jgi:hypothetical protein
MPRCHQVVDCVGRHGWVEADEDCPEVGFQLVVDTRPKIRLDVDDEGGADRREQTSLSVWSTLCGDDWKAETHENQGGVEILIVLLHVFGIVLRRLSFVYSVEIEFGVVVLNRLEVHPQSLLDAVWSQLAGPCNRFCI